MIRATHVAAHHPKWVIVAPNHSNGRSLRTTSPHDPPHSSTCAGVTGVPAIRPDSDATARTASATIANDHSTQRLQPLRLDSRLGPDVHAESGPATGRVSNPPPS
jgi:hypothetical protein